MENIAITNTKYSVDLLNKYPHVIFVFGDNMIRKGKGGQAIIRDWLQHALEETLDLANYLQAAISKLDEEGN